MDLFPMHGGSQVHQLGGLLLRDGLRLRPRLRRGRWLPGCGFRSENVLDCSLRDVRLQSVVGAMQDFDGQARLFLLEGGFVLSRAELLIPDPAKDRDLFPAEQTIGFRR